MWLICRFFDINFTPRADSQPMPVWNLLEAISMQINSFNEKERIIFFISIKMQ